MPERSFDILGRGPRIVVGMLAGLLVALATGCETSTPARSAVPPPVVTLGEVTRGTVPISMKFSGTAQAVKTVEITPRVTGYINERYFVEGAQVEKGAPLYLIDPRPFEDKLQELKGNLKVSQASLDFWNKEVTRYTNLVAENAGSKQQLDEAIDKRDEAQAQIEATQAQIANAELNLSFTRINAPLDGRMEQTQINVGNLVTQDQSVLSTLVTLDPIYVIFNITREQIFQMQQLAGQGYEISKERPLDNVAVKFYLPAGNLYDETGKIDFVSAQIDTNTDSLTARAVVANPATNDDITFIPGQYVPVELILGERQDALLIPQSAVVQSQIGSQVFVVDDQNMVQARTITLGKTYRNMWVVEDGLKVGERVVIEGTQKVKSGVTVNLQPTTPQPATPQPATPQPATPQTATPQPGNAAKTPGDAAASEQKDEPTKSPTKSDGGDSEDAGDKGGN